MGVFLVTCPDDSGHGLLSRGRVCLFPLSRVSALWVLLCPRWVRVLHAWRGAFVCGVMCFRSRGAVRVCYLLVEGGGA